MSYWFGTSPSHMVAGRCVRLPGSKTAVRHTALSRGYTSGERYFHPSPPKPPLIQTVLSSHTQARTFRVNQ
ncbi:hypothetical protein PISMIDRAFT_15408 [Pisolithus microcarpus 441]|uniref:Uncharacterized protein n=1 Tax=Pisolithus microcarpus 441 TaxID=765257 RepID=A0A0C9Z3V0_9AGAM|nr:hypothetical protein PISMIDRAFT_15408 [Pisolithus microcarpus 441]